MNCNMGSKSFLGSNYGIQVGDNYGRIDANFHLPPERPETPPSPLQDVPFPRNADFVTRNTLLPWIHEKSSVPASRIALVGLGGVGKTQLAIEYCYQVLSQSPVTWVFWVHASNMIRFEEGFRAIADRVKIPGRQDPQANIFKLVEDWLWDKKRGKWLLIIDNADDDGFLCKPPTTGTRSQFNLNLTKPLLEYLPRNTNGSIIFTSRSREIAAKMVDDKNLIEIKPMEMFEALELLQRKLEQPGGDQESRKLVKALEFMPLAIIQAARYIRKRSYSVSQYLEVFQESDREAVRLLKKEAGHVHRDWEAKNSIMVTWQISFDYIRQTEPSAAELLSLMSFFDRQGIPEILIRPQPNVKCISRSNPQSDSSEGETSESDTGATFKDDIETLEDYSFISSSSNGLFTMHRLVQLSTRTWLRSHGKIHHWREKCISNLFCEFPTGLYKDWAKCQLLVPHLRSVMSQRPKSPESLRQWATLLLKGAWYASQRGDIADVREMASKSRIERLALSGEEHEEFLDSTDMLATAYSLEGLWKEAEKLFLQVLETRKTKLGHDHPNTLRSMANLAVAYRNQGRWGEAKQIQLQVMETSKAKLGDDHSDTLRSMGNLAVTYRSLGQWKEATQLHTQVMKTYKTKLGDDHPDTLRSMANLASMHWSQGRAEEAEQLDLYVVEKSKTNLGDDHPDTLICMGNLASTYSDQGRWEEAERLEIQVIEIRKSKFGEHHPDTLSCMGNLASTYLDQGRWEEAEQLQIQVLEIYKMTLGKHHPNTLTSIANLASIYSNQGRQEEAEKLNVYVIGIRKTKLGSDHHDTLTSIANLASAYSQQGRWGEAEQLFVQVIEIRKTKLGEHHPMTLKSIANLAYVYSHQGRWGEAEKFFMQIIEICKIKLGGDHPDTLASVANLASAYLDQGRWEEAEQLLIQVIETRKMKHGSDHPNTLTSMANLAVSYMSQCRWEEAEKLLIQVIETRKTKIGGDHPHTLTSMANLASTYRKRGRQEEAEQLDVYVIGIRKTKLGSDHPDTLTSIVNLASEYLDQGRWKEAKQLLVQAKETRKMKLGSPSHADEYDQSGIDILDQGR